MADDQSRNHPATPRRLQKARDGGDVPLSREVANSLAFGFACLSAWLIGPHLLENGITTLGIIVSDSYDRQLTDGTALKAGMLAAAELGISIAAASALGGILGVLVQTRFLVRVAALRVNISRLNPAQGFRRLFGADGLTEILKAIVKLVLMAAVSWFLLAGKVNEFALLPWVDRNVLLELAKNFGFKLLIGAVLVQASTAICDLLIVRFRFQNRHRMSREDLKEEFKETEGNPHTKTRIRRLQRNKRRNMVKGVQSATVVVTNPTHYAVALAYDKAISAAPRITAKGADLVAQRIKELAGANHVPVVESPALARALFRLELDTEIPPEYYKAVAEIVAFVWRLKGRTGRRR